MKHEGSTTLTQSFDRRPLPAPPKSRQRFPGLPISNGDWTSCKSPHHPVFLPSSYLGVSLHGRYRKPDHDRFDQGTGDLAQGDPAAAPVGRGYAVGGREHAGRRAAQASAAVRGDEA